MAFDWNDLRVFLALERGGSARAASATLGTSHSTVLRRLQALETGLDTRVFDRTPDGLVLTEAGARLLPKAQQIEADTLEMTRDVLGADVRLSGPIRLTAPPPVARYLLSQLARFRADYPAIDLTLVSSYAFADLARRDADVAIRFARAPEDHLVGRRLPVFRDAVYATQDYLAGRDPTDLAWIGWPDAPGFLHRIAPTPFADHRVVWRLPDLELQAEAARMGQGMALLPCIMGDSDSALVRVPGSATYDTLPGWILTRPDLRRMERVRVFARALAKAITADRDRVGGVLSDHSAASA